MERKHQIEKIIKQSSDKSIKYIVIDGFCGLGGVTAGFSLLSGWKVIACINHWDVAIDTHEKNFPDCLHLQEDFETADLTDIKYMINQIKVNNPGIKIHLWLSLECTNFSNAKGGMSRDADSRTLADHVDRYVIELAPDVIWVENVREFLLWGPMLPKIVVQHGKRKKQIRFDPNCDNVSVFEKYTENGLYPYCPLTPYGEKWMVPDKLRKGRDFKRWKELICSLGYQSDQKIMNCADYGVPQHRVRLIMQFTRKGVSAIWPKRTHSKNGIALPKWSPIKNCLDLTDEGSGVLTFIKRKNKNLVPRIRSEATINRLIEGCKKYVLAGSTDKWIVKYYSACNNTALNKGSSINKPSPTVTCYNAGGYIATAHVVDHYFGNGYVNSIEQPAGVTGTKDGAALHTVRFLDGQYGNSHIKDITQPSVAIMGNPKQNLVSINSFVMDTQYNNVGHSLEEPAKTQTANRKHFYIVNFQWFNTGFRDINRVSNTIISRMDKTPNYLITLETGELAIEVFENDPPHYVKMKKFMAKHGIISINMRMLKAQELLKIMTLPEETILSKSSTDNKKMIGNAVPSELVRKLGNAYSNTEIQIP